MFAPVFYGVFLFGYSKRQFREQLYLPYLSCFEVIGTQAQGKTQRNPIFHSDKSSLFGLGFMKYPLCSVSLKVLNVLDFKKT